MHEASRKIAPQNEKCAIYEAQSCYNIPNMSKTVQSWAFVAPRMSSDLGQYYAGILDAVREDPAIFLHAFVFSDPNVAALAEMDGIISYTVPPKEVMEIFDLLGKPHPPTVVITMCKPTDPSVCYAHIDPHGVAERVAELLAHRHCRSYAFCSPHTPYTTDESAALLLAYRRQIYARTGQMPRLFRPITTFDINLIATEVERFANWFSKIPHPCGMFVHGDDVARKMLDTCRLKGIEVPDELRVVGTGNSPMFCERTYPTLSSYAIDHHRAGMDAARVLKRLIAGELTPQEASYEIPLPDVTERASSVDDRGSARVAQGARDFIADELRHGHTPSARDIAFHLNVSLRKLENDFTSIYGRTLRDEISAVRLDLLAKNLKTSNEPIKTLVARSGFGDMSRAVRDFKRNFGLTMGEFRLSRSGSKDH